MRRKRSGLAHQPTTSTANVPSSSGGSRSRWKPTRDQLNILKELFSEGIGRISDELILETTRKLLIYGPIEAKNVYYWFHNCKTRQRQKQKQMQKQEMDQMTASSAAYFIRFYSPLSPSVAAAAGGTLNLFPLQPTGWRS